MECFIAYLLASKKHPIIVFWEAACYYEKRFNIESMTVLFAKHCMKGDIKGSVTLDTIPEWVEDYCIDAMAKRCKPVPMQFKLKGGE